MLKLLNKFYFYSCFVFFTGSITGSFKRVLTKSTLKSCTKLVTITLCVVFLSVLLISTGIRNVDAKEKKAPTLKWLKLSKEALKYWKPVLSSNDPGKMVIIQKKPPIKDGQLKKILGLIPKRSKSYSQAVSRLLEVLYQKNIVAKITLINFGKIKKRGMVAIKMAEDKNYDLIFSMGSGSSMFIHKAYRGGKIPVVTSTQKDPVPLGQIEGYEKGSGTNIAYTSLNVPLDLQMIYFYQLKPQLNTICLMYNKNHKQVMAVEVIPSKKMFKKLGLHVVDVAVESRSTAKETLAARLPEAIKEMKLYDPTLENSIFLITSSTAVFSQIEEINKFSGNIPVLGSIPNVVSEGDNSAVLAIGIDRRNNAHLAAIYAVKILNGEVKPGDLKVGIVTPPDVAINFRIAKKIGLKIPFNFFENAAFIYDYEGKPVRAFGQKVLN